MDRCWMSLLGMQLGNVRSSDELVLQARRGMFTMVSDWPESHCR
jgi:hypothetical protein